MSLGVVEAIARLLGGRVLWPSCEQEQQQGRAKFHLASSTWHFFEF
jgi:hypothetical protein